MGEEAGCAGGVGLCSGGDRLYAIDQASAQLRGWNAETGSSIGSVQLQGKLTTPVVDTAGAIYVSSDIASSSGDVFFLPQGVRGPSPAIQARSFSEPIRHSLALAPNNELAFISGDVLHVMSRNNLNSSVWTFNPTGQSPSWSFASAPVVDGRGTVFVAGSDGGIHTIRNGTEQWDRSIVAAGTGFTAPALDRNGGLYVGTSLGEAHKLQRKPDFQIAFEGDVAATGTLDLYTLRERFGNAGNLTRLTADQAPDATPTFSSLGQWMAFSSAQGNTRDVFIGTGGAQAIQNLTAPSATGSNPFTVESDETDPAFSPTDFTGRSLLFDGKHYLAVTTGEASRRLFFIDLGQWHQSANVTGLGLSGWIISQVGSDFRNAQAKADNTTEAAFSPGGDKLAYSAWSEQANGQYLSELVVLDLDGPSRQVVTKTVQDSSIRFAPDFAPSSNPKHDRLTYVAPDGSLWITKNMSQAGHVVAAAPSLGLTQYNAPAWSPDGSEIVLHRSVVSLSGGGGVFGSPASSFEFFLDTRHGSNYGSSAQISGNVSRNGDFHPRRLPALNVNPPNVSTILHPRQQAPGKTVKIRGYGFDINFPQNNDVYFPDVTGGLVKAEITDAWVDDQAGVGVLEAKVPDLAGDGQIVVDTPFGPSSRQKRRFRLG